MASSASVNSVQAKRGKFTPKTVTLEGGIKLSTPMATKRATPASKTSVKLYNNCCR